MLARAIRSVLAQTYRGFELIIVDDASPDNTREVVASFDDERIIYIRRQENGGASAARNTGIRQARGRYISFLDDDDEYLPEFLENTFLEFEAAPAHVGFMWCGIRIVRDTPDGEIVVRDKLWKPPSSGDREQRRLAFIRSQAVATSYGLTIRATCFETVGLFDESFRMAVDAEFFVRLGRSYDGEAIDATLVKFRRHSESALTDRTPQRAEAYEQIVRKHSGFFEEHPSLWVSHHYRTGVLHYAAGNRARGREFLFKALRRDPFHWRSWRSLLYLEISRTNSLGLGRRMSSWLKRTADPVRAQDKGI
jgi:glycosyltransferase involved in cell wall biosynthesis